MAEVTEQMVIDFKAALDAGKAPMQFIRQNKLGVNFKQLRDAFVEAYSLEEFQSIMKARQFTMMTSRFSMIVGRLKDTESCDSLAVELNKILDEIAVKKAQIEAE
jgi:hypothetical protein